MEKEIRDYNALTMSEKNPFYTKFLAVRQSEKYKKYMEKHKKNMCFGYESDDNPEKIEYEFLLYVTKLYFRDNVFYSMLKLLFGITAIFVLLAISKSNIRPRIKSFAMTLALGYGLIQTPLAVLYIISYLSCRCHAADYVSTRNSAIASKIIEFYDPETDKLQSINLRNYRFTGEHKQRKRTRGW